MKATLKMLTKNCESEIYMKEKEKCEIYLKYMKAKCESMWKWKMLSKYKW